MHHVPVLLDESLEFLVTDLSGKYLDGTIGFGGHSTEILKMLNADAKLIAVDKDVNAFNHCKKIFDDDKRVKLFNTGFSNIDTISKIEFINKYNGIFADLGVSSFQLDNADSGFTYREDALLDLRMNKEEKLTARDIVNSYSEEAKQRFN
jgi:16S rRNA (cytosine1402-N4)-methyltransferase